MLANITRFGFAEGPSRRGFKGTGGFVLDMSEVIRNMDRLNTKVMPSKIRKGLRLAGLKFMSDTVIGLPHTMPIRRGDPPYTDERKAGELRASGALFVDGEKRGTSRRYGETATGKYQPSAYGGTRIPKNSHEACIVFNAPYAATQHESFPAKTEPSAGMHFMSDKLYTHGAEYIEMVAEEVRL